MNRVDIAVRSYVKEKYPKPDYHYPQHPYVFYDRILVFDTETTIDQYQNLMFGSFQIYEKSRFVYDGIFYGEILYDEQVGILRSYAEKKDIPLFTRLEFVDQVFYPEVYDNHVMCVGFNLPFDLSRLAEHVGKAKGRNKGGFSLQLSVNRIKPWIVIKHSDSTKSFISFNNAKNDEIGNNRHRRGRTNKYRGRFLDLRTLSFSLTNKKFTLRSAGEHFNCEVLKNETDSHGKITPNYILYNLNDVDATYSLYLKLKDEYGKYNLDTPIHKIYSPASIGKAYLKAMRLESFTVKNPNFPPELLGYIMTTYFGGRSEVKIRKEPTSIAYMDVLSMYPTVNILQDLWKFVICERIDRKDDTEKIRELLKRINLKSLQDQDTWKDLHVICMVEPEEDILPVRAHYGEKNVFNIGINFLSSEKGIWYSLSDVISSKLLSGKIPKISKAIRFDPVGIQKNLRKIQILHGIEFCPENHDLFKILIEERKKLKIQKQNLEKSIFEKSENLKFEIQKLDSNQNILKIITNSTSYGIFVEINTNEKSNVNLEIYGLDKFETVKNKVEENGTMFNPIMGAFITSGARLILAITEKILENHEETYAFCDTDSMAVPIERVEDIGDYFKDLNPYSFEADIFELEDENFEPKDWNDLKKGVKKDQKIPLWFYGISAKRYVLYNIRDGKPVIRKYSSHGLGHLLNPFKKDDKKWHERIWKDILSIVYEINTLEDVLESYRNKYAISQLSISSPEIMKRMKMLNKGKDYLHQIKPFNFVIVGTARENRKHTLEDIKPLIPYTKNYHEAPYKSFIEYHTGEWMQGIQYWKSMEEVFWDYYTHPESKFDGDMGILERKHLQVGTIIHMGKESNKLEESDILGVKPNNYERYDTSIVTDLTKLKYTLFHLTPKMAERYRIPRHVLYSLQDKIKRGMLDKIPDDIRMKLWMILEVSSIKAS